MGPLEMPGTGSAAAQGKTPSCAAGSRGTGERTGPAARQAQRGRAEPASSPHIFLNAGEAQSLPTARGVHNLGKHLPWGRSQPQSSADPLCDESLAALPDVMLFAGTHTPRITFSLVQHFFWLTSHPWPAWLQLAPRGRGANPPQHGPAIGTLTPGTSWGCQAGLAHGAARPRSPSSSPCRMTHLGFAAPASSPLSLFFVPSAVSGRLASTLSFFRSDEAFSRTHSVALSAVSVPLLLMSGAF